MLNSLSLIIVSIGIALGSLVPNFSVSTNPIPKAITNQIQSLQTTIGNILARLNLLPRNYNANANTVEPDTTAENTKTVTDRTVLNAANILYFINKERTGRGLHALKTDSKLTKSARAKSADMITYNYFAHQSPLDQKKDFAYFIDQQSYIFIRISENLAMGEFSSAQEVVDAWMKSPAHAANILFADYRDTGISVQQKPNPRGGYDTIIVQHFGLKKNTCPSISQEITAALQTIQSDAVTAKQKADDLKKQIDAQQTKLSSDDLDNLIGIYNTTIRSYNALAQKFTAITDQYNKEAEIYNNCIMQ